MAATRSRNPPLSKQLRDRGSGPQGLRRPRFSFFLFTCQTARNHGGPVPGSPESIRSPKPPTKIGSLVTVVSEELRRHAIAPVRQTARRNGLYSPAWSLLSTLVKTRKAGIFCLAIAAPTQAFGKRRASCAGVFPRPTAATFLRRSCASGGRCSVGVFAPASRSEATGVTRPAA